MRRQNYDDAMAKLQEILDRAVWAVTPAIVDPATVKRVKAKCSPSFLIKYTGEFKSLSDLERGAVDALRTVATEKADKHINDIFEHCAKHCKENKLSKARAITDMKKFCDAAVQVAGGGCGDRP